VSHWGKCGEERSESTSNWRGEDTPSGSLRAVGEDQGLWVSTGETRRKGIPTSCNPGTHARLLAKIRKPVKKKSEKQGLSLWWGMKFKSRNKVFNFGGFEKASRVRPRAGTYACTYARGGTFQGSFSPESPHIRGAIVKAAVSRGSP